MNSGTFLPFITTKIHFDVCFENINAMIVPPEAKTLLQVVKTKVLNYDSPEACEGAEKAVLSPGETYKLAV